MTPGKQTTYSYDYENRLIRIIYPDGKTSEYQYDGAGRRVQAEEDGEVTKYLYDGLNPIIERDHYNYTKATYVRGLSYGGGIGSIISQKYPLEGNTYYHYDAQGNVTSLTDDFGDLKQQYTYDAYGNLLSAQRYTRRKPTPNSYLFSTKEYSPQSGFYYFGARYYDPRVGRWLSRDPVPALNLYVYCKNNPLNLVDPFGLDTYYVNRTFEKAGKAQPTSRRYFHSFVAITDNGTVTDTYSWGNGQRSKWFHNDPVDMAVAQKAIDSKIGIKRYGGEDLDPFVAIEFNKRKNDTTPYNRWTNNCKENAGKLLEDARKLKKGKEKLR